MGAVSKALNSNVFSYVIVSIFAIGLAIAISGLFGAIKKDLRNTADIVRYTVEEHRLSDGTVCAVTDNAITCAWARTPQPEIDIDELIRISGGEK